MRFWKWAGPVFFITVTIGTVIIWFENEEALIAWKSELKPLPFFALLTVAGTIGVPTSPFYILAGILFGPWIALTGAASSVLGYQVLSYGIARGPLRGWTDQVRLLIEKQTPDGLLQKPVVRIALVRVIPGLPAALKNYAAAAMGAKLPLYLAVSWPLSFIGAAALVVLGDSLATKRPEEAVIALIILLPVALIAYYVRNRWKRQNNSGGNELTRRQAVTLSNSRPCIKPSLFLLFDRRLAGGQR